MAHYGKDEVRSPLPVVRFEVSSLGPRPVAAARSPLEAELSELKESLEELATENQAQERRSTACAISSTRCPRRKPRPKAKPRS